MSRVKYSLIKASFWVIIGGFVGTLLRFILNDYLGAWLLNYFQIKNSLLFSAAILVIVNLLGCIYLAMIHVFVAHGKWEARQQFIQGQGIAGALTTFSGISLFAIYLNGVQGLQAGLYTNLYSSLTGYFLVLVWMHFLIGALGYFFSYRYFQHKFENSYKMAKPF